MRRGRWPNAFGSLRGSGRRWGRWTEWPDTLVGAVNMVLETSFSDGAVVGAGAGGDVQRRVHAVHGGEASGDRWVSRGECAGRRRGTLSGQSWRRRLARGERFYFENQLIPVVRQGVLTDVYWTYGYSPIRDAAGTVCGVMAIAIDVTAKLTAEQERDAIAASLKHVLESTTDGLATLDKEWRYTYMNEQGARMVGLRPADFHGEGSVGAVSGGDGERSLGGSIGWRWRRGSRGTSMRVGWGS